MAVSEPAAINCSVAEAAPPAASPASEVVMFRGRLQVVVVVVKGTAVVVVVIAIGNEYLFTMIT